MRASSSGVIIQRDTMAMPSPAITGIAFDLSDELRPIYARFGRALPDKNGDDSWVLPVPATFVIDRDGLIVLAFVDVDYRNRLEPAEIVKVLNTMTARRAA